MLEQTSSEAQAAYKAAGVDYDALDAAKRDAMARALAIRRCSLPGEAVRWTTRAASRRSRSSWTGAEIEPLGIVYAGEELEFRGVGAPS